EMPEFYLDDTHRVAPERFTERVLGVELVVVEGPSRGERVQLKGNIARVGTADGSTLRIHDPTVSRVHCELVVAADAVTVRDLGSTNGTFVGEARVREADVRPGAVVKVGASAFRVDAGETPTFIPLSDKTALGELIGASAEMRAVYAVLERAAPT